jgi:hypothetical protein
MKSALPSEHDVFGKSLVNLKGRMTISGIRLSDKSNKKTMKGPIHHPVEVGGPGVSRKVGEAWGR